mgnify:CR=1 FL=1
MLFPKEEEKKEEKKRGAKRLGMERIVESQVFTDEQKVQVIKAVVDKNIEVSMNCNFEQINDYYFIVVNNVYSYAMTFKDGFQFLKLYTSNKTIIKELTAVAYPLKNACFDYIINGNFIVYNKETIFPYMRYNIKDNALVYFSKGENAEIIKNIFDKFPMYFYVQYNLIESSHTNKINLCYLNLDEIDSFTFENDNIKIHYKKQIEKPKPKDKYMKMVDEKIYGKQEYTQFIINSIKKDIIKCIKKAQADLEDEVTVEVFHTYPEITEFIEYICKTKNFTFTNDSPNQFTITFQ